MIARAIFPVAQKRLQQFPVVAVTGPRQSGKTTLAQALADGRPYVSLENPDTRTFALRDPRGFLAQFPDGAVLDEVQRCPELFSYLQGIVDADGRPGLFILTGSQQFGLVESITQSLAGRISLLRLLPFSLGELQAAGIAPADLDTLLCHGLFPPIHARPVEPSAWLEGYVETYLGRDVRQTLRVQDLEAFQRFLRLCAGRAGQLLNINSLAADAGISRPTANAWLSILQAGNAAFLLRPQFRNHSRQFIKAPKLYFCDTGLLSWLLGIRKPAHLVAHPLRGAIFENWVVTELLKQQLALGAPPAITYWRDKQGHEIDAVVETAPSEFHAIEIKSGQTVAPDFFDNLDFWRRRFP
ncbi:MAG: ATP-binding protein, partial [Opitutaceae bacterium]|nr:ATP-binding protein [Opitutaceae bacterium]